MTRVFFSASAKGLNSPAELKALLVLLLIQGEDLESQGGRPDVVKVLGQMRVLLKVPAKALEEFKLLWG
jgi:hypothetical protein